MHFAAGEQDYEAAALDRNRLQAVRALLERQRVANEGAGTLRRRRGRVRGDRGQRAGLPGPRRRAQRPPVVLPRQPGRAAAGGRRRGVHPPVLRERAVDPVAARRPGRRWRTARRSRSSSRSWPSAAAARSRSGRPSAAPSAGSSTWPSATRGSRSTRRSSRPSAGASSASRRSTASSASSGWTRCRCGSSASTSRTSAARTRSRRWSCSRAARRRSPITGVLRSARSSPATITGPWRRCCHAATRSGRSRPSARPYDAERDASFGALPNLIVIDGGKGQLAAGLEPLAGLPRARRRGRLAGQADRGGLPPGRARRRCVLAARHARAAAPAARARRGAPVRDHPPPDPARQGDDRVDHGRAAGDRAGPQARAAAALRLARRGAGRQRARSSSACPGSRRRSPAPSTPTSTRPDDELARNGRGPSHLEDFVIISGLSGAGKSSAMNVFEDAGYFCVDNLPAEMIRSLAELFRHSGSKVERAAVVSRLARRRVPVGAGRRDRRARRGRRSSTACCSWRPTSRRCSTATRRPAAGIRSPRTAASPTASGASATLLAPVRERADWCIDTSGLSLAALRRKVADELLEPGHARPAGGDVHVVRPQARPAARRRPRARRPLPARTRTTRPTCGR